MYKYLFILILFLSGCASIPKIPRIEGDCVDRAVAIRQSLREQGYEAKIIMGIISRGKGHAWVEYKDKKTGEWKKIRNYLNGN